MSFSLQALKHGSLSSEKLTPGGDISHKPVKPVSVAATATAPVQDRQVTATTSTTPTATPTFSQDSFMLESDPNMTSPTHSVTLTTPGCYDDSQDIVQQSSILHDHTYSQPATPPSPTAESCEPVRGVVSVTESIVNVTSTIIQEEGVVTEGDNWCVLDETGSELSQELFSESSSEGESVNKGGMVVSEVECEGGVAKESKRGVVLEAEGMGREDRTDTMEHSDEVSPDSDKVGASGDTDKPAEDVTDMESEPGGVRSGMESNQDDQPDRMELESPPPNSESNAGGVSQESEPNALPNATPLATGSPTPPDESSATPTSSDPTPGMRDVTVDELIEFLPSCEVSVHKSTEVNCEQLHTLTNKLLNFIFTVNEKIKSVHLNSK